MNDNYGEPTYSWDFSKLLKPKKSNPLINIGLFIVTFITTTIAGAEWTSGTMGPMQLSTLIENGLPYAITILLFLSFHEFGHYFAAKYHGVDTTLPYYIPFPPIPFFLNFGTMGAVIKTKSSIPNNKIMFDIGIAGPLAGFVICLLILIYGFMNVPDVNYILSIHPDYFQPEYGEGAISLEFGDSILFILLRNLFVDPGQFFPPMSEIYHYPYLCVGWFGLFVTTMNLIPVGQLDGGHILFGMFGEKKHEIVASISMIILIFMGVFGIVESFFELGINFGWSGWLFWSVILFFIIKVKHPPVPVFEPITGMRRVLGYISMFILIISFSPTPFVLTLPPGM
ncbi:MAG: site-2 protease family protein [Melioribacteraceae bacterium]|nr:site-2 protease family protein [Melioribacteraceae bacterium]